MKVCFDTFGCRLNRAEALEMEAKFLKRGWTSTDKHSEADMIVIRACSVTARAQRDCARLADHIRAKYPMKRLVVTGCTTKKKNEHWLKDLAGDTDAVPVASARAYLKVQDGCAGRCSFCIVPKFRGEPTSVPLQKCIDKAGRFAGAGYKEIVVTGCSLTQYNDNGKRLPELAAALAEALPECRFRLGSVEPVPLANEVVAAMSEHPNICNFLHLPVQSGSARILTAMRRPYLARDVDAIAKNAVSLMPDVALGCDLMTGFPDEMPNDHLATMAFLRRHPFSNVHVFKYSERPGTVAATLPGAVPPEIRMERAREIADVACEMRRQYARRFRGRTVEVAVEDEKTLGGWTPEYLWCEIGQTKAKVFAHSRKLKNEGSVRKSVIRVLVTDVSGDTLKGDVV